MSPTQAWHLLRLHLRWRKAKRRGGTLRPRIGDVRGFLEKMDTQRIPYVVLRWFEEVPLDLRAEAALTEDIDLLVDHTRLPELIRIAARHPGSIRCDLYSPAGKRGTSYKKMPYYPPAMAQEILEHRVRYKDSFFVPDPLRHFLSLAYHVTYHKGADSGIPGGTPSFGTPPPGKRLYGERVQALGDALGIDVARPYTLLGLHNYLKSCYWSMPYDLMLRWPMQKEWVAELARIEEQALQPYAEQLPNLVVFLLRADAAENEELQAATIAEIESRFRILKKDRLDSEAMRRVTRTTRGGNWLEHAGTLYVPPVMAVICHDEHPVPLAQDDDRRRKYPLITNANVLLKNEFRASLNDRFPQAGHERLLLHATDTALEAQQHLQAVYGNDYPTVCRQLVHMIG